MDGIYLRAIEEGDLEQIMEWRMSPDITRYMNTDPKLTLEGQKKWLTSITANPDVAYWLIEIEGQKAGVISLTGLTREDGILGWSYYVGEKSLRSLRNALALEMDMYEYALVTLGKEAVVGDVFSLNKGVIQLHLLCGCRIREEKKAHVCKEGVWYDVTFTEMTRERWMELRKSKKYDKVTRANEEVRTIRVGK